MVTNRVISEVLNLYYASVLFFYFIKGSGSDTYFKLCFYILNNM